MKNSRTIMSQSLMKFVDVEVVWFIVGLLVRRANRH
jgi:hypothetical protein